MIGTVCLITPPSTEVMEPDGEFTVIATPNTKNWICTKNMEVPIKICLKFKECIS